MSAAETLADARSAAETLADAAARLAHEYGDTLGVRRLLSDVARLKDNLAQIGDPQPGYRPTTETHEILVIDDKPYDESMWSDSDSESQHAV
jgi:hypothetical protein